ncbi:hypothetical protein GGX14DRAFT_539117 [Mycena pura]|uniref:Uncharacterized protein n=1 Tax=Mycena pura TaxID=153505 RepID=A0AAD6YRJ2_9AGAR|nr:hypothetical protein GGX14DRAFT_539117 [Mycena pura]
MTNNSALPRKRKRTWKRIAKKDRRNLKLWAEGARESILKPHIPAYTDALERGWRAERDYLQIVCNEFHARIPWRLADNEEPELPLREYDQFKPSELEDLDEEETAQKRLRIETLNARIGRWLKYRARCIWRPLKMDRTRDPWAILLGKLAGVSSPPKARQGFQQYMHESYDTEITPVVAARWAATCVEDDGTTLKSKKAPDAPFRARVVRELFTDLSAEDQQALRDRAKEAARKAKETYMALMKDVHPVPPVRMPPDAPTFLPVPPYASQYLRMSGDSEIQCLGDSAIRCLGDSAIRRFGDSAIRRFGGSQPPPNNLRRNHGSFDLGLLSLIPAPASASPWS